MWEGDSEGGRSEYGEGKCEKEMVKVGGEGREVKADSSELHFTFFPMLLMSSPLNEWLYQLYRHSSNCCR